MINITQFRALIAEPTLRKIPNGYSPEALTAIMMIIAHESRGGHYLHQITGPALGAIQMEPRTHDSVWLHGDTCSANALIFGWKTPDENRLIWDLQYNVFMARQFLFMIPDPIPTDFEAISKYLKKYWNTPGGKAEDFDYLIAYERWTRG